MIVGGFVGGALAREPLKFNQIGWMPYVTQAGVSLGLATVVAHAFPEWGTQFATVIIAVIVLNQIVGPPLFKWAITYAGEAHTRHSVPEFDGIKDAIIFGLEDQSIALAHQLKSNGWEVKVASRRASQAQVNSSEADIRVIKDLNLEALNELEADKSEAIVAMLSDDENYQLCELIYEHIGTQEIIVRLNDRANFDKFHKLGCLIVEPATAIVSLLDHFVRSPLATSLLLGMDENQDTIDVEVRSKDVHGISLRDLRLPIDVIILSVSRGGHSLISHGYTRLRTGDIVTIVGSRESLRSVELRFDG
jgi:Trk K+ transport system NAD-binding subunit